MVPLTALATLAMEVYVISSFDCILYFCIRKRGNVPDPKGVQNYRLSNYLTNYLIQNLRKIRAKGSQHVLTLLFDCCYAQSILITKILKKMKAFDYKLSN